MSDLPEPLTPADCDLRGMPFMPVDLVRLFDSDLYALSTGDEFKAAFTLWGKAFLQVPAGSVPNDDRILAHLSGCGSGWRKVKDMALRGWIKASDGRLYHPVVAEKAREAWASRVAQRARTEAARAARAASRQSSDRGPTDDATQSVATSVTDTATGSKGQGQGQGQGQLIKKEDPLTPDAGAPGGKAGSAIGRKARPPGWAGQHAGLRATGTNPRAVAEAAKPPPSAAPPPPEITSPLWPAFRARGMSTVDFRHWIEPLDIGEVRDGRVTVQAPKRFHADHVRKEWGPALEAAVGARVDLVAVGAAA